MPEFPCSRRPILLWAFMLPVQRLIIPRRRCFQSNSSPRRFAAWTTIPRLPRESMQLMTAGLFTFNLNDVVDDDGARRKDFQGAKIDAFEKFVVDHFRNRRPLSSLSSNQPPPFSLSADLAANSYLPLGRRAHTINGQTGSASRAAGQ